MRRLARLLPLLALVAAAGCNEYHYYDINVKFNLDSANGGFSPIGNEVTTIQVCIMNVTGADSDSMRMGPFAQGLPVSSTGVLGIVEFSTFADSGQLTFTMSCYDDTTTTNDCKTGEGTKTVNVSTATTVNEELIVNRVAAGCLQ
jgi:hypothetical protein